MSISLYLQVISKKDLRGIADKAMENHNFWGNKPPLVSTHHPKAVNDKDKFPRIS